MRREIEDEDEHWGKAVHPISYLCTEPDEKIIILPNFHQLYSVPLVGILMTLLHSLVSGIPRSHAMQC
jgi:hypothetical protein